MSIEWDVVAAFAAPIVALFVGAALDRARERRPRLVTYLGHVSAFKIRHPDGTTTDVFTHALVVRNAGRKPAENVRLVHKVLPDFQVTPETRYKVTDLPQGGKEIVLDRLVSKEQVEVSYLYFPPVTYDQVNTAVRSDEGMAKVVRVLPTPQLGPIGKAVVLALLFMGLVASLYIAYSLVAALLVD